MKFGHVVINVLFRLLAFAFPFQVWKCGVSQEKEPDVPTDSLFLDVIPFMLGLVLYSYFFFNVQCFRLFLQVTYFMIFYFSI